MGVYEVATAAIVFAVIIVWLHIEN